MRRPGRPTAHALAFLSWSYPGPGLFVVTADGGELQLRARGNFTPGSRRAGRRMGGSWPWSRGRRETPRSTSWSPTARAASGCRRRVAIRRGRRTGRGSHSCEPRVTSLRSTPSRPTGRTSGGSRPIGIRLIGGTSPWRGRRTARCCCTGVAGSAWSRWTGNPWGSERSRPGEGYSAAWSPDGTRIAILTLDGRWSDDPVLVTTTVDGAEPQVLVIHDDEHGLLGIGVAGDSEPVDVSGCTSGTAVASPAANPGLVGRLRSAAAGPAGFRGECARRPELESRTADRSEWDGVVVDGTPPRVASS